MSKLSSKRQITLPVEHCNELNIQPGDDLEFFVANGQLTAVKKHPEAAKGILKGLKVNKAMTDEESRQSSSGR